MSAQPLNTEISVYRAVRSMRNRRLLDSVASVTKRQRPLIMNVPGRDAASVVNLALDTTKKDFSPYARDGQPIVVGQYGDLYFDDAQAHTTGVDVYFQIGQDKFLTNTASGLTRDLHKDLRTAEDTYKATNTYI